jgi:hypothetical protein
MHVLDTIRALARFKLFRQQAAIHIAWPLVVLARLVFAWPPANFASWPTSAQEATANLIGGSYWLVFVGWLALCLKPTVWIDREPLRTVVKTACNIAMGYCVAAAILRLSTALVGLTSLPAEGVAAIVLTVARVVGIPLVIGLLPLGWYTAHERIATMPYLRRLFVAGQGATGAFMSGEEIRKYTRPLPKRLT